jgi:hypothetical protein
MLQVKEGAALTVLDEDGSAGAHDAAQSYVGRGKHQPPLDRPATAPTSIFAAERYHDLKFLSIQEVRHDVPF